MREYRCSVKSEPCGGLDCYSCNPGGCIPCDDCGYAFDMCDCIRCTQCDELLPDLGSAFEPLPEVIRCNECLNENKSS